MSFRPIFWPTVISIPLIFVLIGLGSWQVLRFQRKVDLVSQIQERTTADARVVNEFVAAMPAPADRNYWRVSAQGVFDHAREAHLFTTDDERGPGYHVITPLRRTSGPDILINRGFVPDDKKAASARPEGQITGLVEIAGIVRVPGEPGTFVPDNQPEDNIWFYYDIDALSDFLGVEEVLPFIIEADASPNPGGWPEGGKTRITLANDHLSYVLTWYGLALALIVIYFVYHADRGRLSFGIARANQDE